MVVYYYYETIWNCKLCRIVINLGPIFIMILPSIIIELETGKYWVLLIPLVLKIYIGSSLVTTLKTKCNNQTI